MKLSMPVGPQLQSFLYEEADEKLSLSRCFTGQSSLVGSLPQEGLVGWGLHQGILPIVSEQSRELLCNSTSSCNNYSAFSSTWLDSNITLPSVLYSSVCSFLIAFWPTYCSYFIDLYNSNCIPQTQCYVVLKFPLLLN